MSVLLVTTTAAHAVPRLSGRWRGTISSGMQDSYAELIFVLDQDGAKPSGEFARSSGTVDCHAPAGQLSGPFREGDFTDRLPLLDGHLCGLSGALKEGTIRGGYSCHDAVGKDRGEWPVTLETSGRQPTLGQTPTP